MYNLCFDRCKLKLNLVLHGQPTICWLRQYSCKCVKCQIIPSYVWYSSWLKLECSFNFDFKKIYLKNTVQQWLQTTVPERKYKSKDCQYNHHIRSCRKPICFGLFLKHRRCAHYRFCKPNHVSVRSSNWALSSTSIWIWNGILLWRHSV